MFTFALVKQNNGAIAQLVEQRTENPCVPGSIPGGTTCKTPKCFFIKRFGVFRFSHYTQESLQKSLFKSQ